MGGIHHRVIMVSRLDGSRVAVAGNVGSYDGEGKGHWIYGARWLMVEVVGWRRKL